MLKRSTSLIATICAALTLVSTVTFLEVRAAGRMYSTSYTSSEDTKILEYNLGYLEAPAGTPSDIPPDSYWLRITAVRDASTAYVEMFSYGGTLVASGPVDATTYEYSESGYASNASIDIAMMETSEMAEPYPAPSAPPSTPSPSPSPSAPPSPPTTSPTSTTTSGNGVIILWDGPPGITGTLIIPWQGQIRGQGVVIGFGGRKFSSPSPSPGSTSTPTR